ncbi:MAG: NUDIX hydrolase, partial [Planctomycetota bacterium]|nr:NUDIX hydrolase [Planctomycetota bacterium]
MSDSKTDVQTIAATPHLKLVTRDGWSYVQRCQATGVVTVIPRSSKGIVFVEQFRPPVQASVIEFPAGLAGDIEGKRNESLEAAARRELLEETGFEAQNMTEIFTGPSSAGLTDEL